MLAEETNTFLEVFKIAIPAITALLVVVAGFVLNRRLKTIESSDAKIAQKQQRDHDERILVLRFSETRNQQLIAHRLEIYERISYKLNDLFCFFMCRGHFRRLDPPKMVDLKRDVDREIHSFRGVFSKQHFDAYEAFMGLYFQTYRGASRDAGIRADWREIKRQRGERVKWKDSWSECFVKNGQTSPTDLERSYMDLVRSFASEFGADQSEKFRQLLAEGAADEDAAED